MPVRRRRGSGPAAAPGGVPCTGPTGPRRPAAPAAAASAPGKGENRPSPNSLVLSGESSTQGLPDLRARVDDAGRAFLYIPTHGNIEPPAPSWGPRRTDRLTPRGARQIKGAAIKAGLVDLSLVTFVTFTFRPADRLLIEEGELNPGKEMRRTLNAMQERFRRQGYPDFAYVWVAENPKMETGENPHVHMLTNHRVPFEEFGEFAAWLESLWGHGWAKVEKIRKPESAGRYILKAVKYVAKGEDGAQGTIYGNRYGISQNIRVREEVLDLWDREDAAHTLRGLIASLHEDEEVLELTEGMYLTKHGVSVVSDVTRERLAWVLCDLEELASLG